MRPLGSRLLSARDSFAPGLAGLAVYLTLRASLPELDGEVLRRVASSQAMQRDELGTRRFARLRAAISLRYRLRTRQDRFFQMDLMRRAAAGELAELLGKPVLELDEKYRIHGFRRTANTIVQDSAGADRELLAAYTAGVNFALQSAAARPWEYTLLRSQPAPWRIEDCVLVAFSMYLNLNDSSGDEELARARLQEVLPRTLYDFMHPLGPSGTRRSWAVLASAAIPARTSSIFVRPRRAPRGANNRSRLARRTTSRSSAAIAGLLRHA